MKKFYYLLIFTLTVLNIKAQTIRYVKETATGAADGSSWQDATTLADALKDAKQNENNWTEEAPLQIWVSSGIHKPKYRADNLDGTNANDRDNTFVLVKNVKIYGGFGGNETSLDARDWKNNATILSGDLGIANDNTDNALHVLISAGEVGVAELNGVIITGGNAANSNGYITVNNRTISRTSGGGMCNTYSSPKIVNCVFRENHSEYAGGAMDVYFSSSKVVNCIFRENSSFFAGGMHNSSSSVTLTNCVFNRNTANVGGALVNFSTSGNIYNTIIVGNTDEGEGGNIYSESSSLTIQHSLIGGGYTGNDYEEESNNNLPNFLEETQVFVDPINGDYRLKSCSIAVNAGSNNLYTNNGGNTTNDKDFAGNSRVYESTIDLGVYELQQNVETTSPPAPIVNNASVTISYGDDATEIEAALNNSITYDTDNNVLWWYTTETGGTPAPAPSTLEIGTTSYWVSQVSSSCGRGGSRVGIEVTVVKKELTVALTKEVTKAYDGNNNVIVNLDGSYFTLNGVKEYDYVEIESITYDSATYNDATVGTDKLVTVASPTITLVGFDAENYTTSTADISGNVGIIEEVVGLEETILSELLIYPNPVKDVLIIETKAVIQEIEVYAKTGQLVLKSQSTTLDMSSLSSGVYYIKIETDKGSTTKKVIKK